MIRLLRNEQYKNDMLQRSGKSQLLCGTKDIRKMKMKAPMLCSGKAF
jgi:hypothetical protein